MKLTSLYRWILKEQPQPEATPPNNVFGNWLAPSERGLPVEEPNTPEEDEVIDALGDFMGRGNNPVALSQNGGKIANELVSLMRNHQYSPILEPGVEQTYRGLSFTDFKHFQSVMKGYASNIKSLFVVREEGLNPEAMNPQQFATLQDGQFFLIYGEIGPFTLQTTQNRLVQSWSASKSIALDFVNKSSLGGLLLQASVSKNTFFGKPGEVGKVGGFPEEMETISVGPIATDGAKFIYGVYISTEDVTSALDS